MDRIQTLSMRAIAGVESEAATVVHPAEMARLRAKYAAELKDAEETYHRSCNAVTRAYLGRLMEIIGAQDRRNRNNTPDLPEDDGGTENAW